MKHFVIVYDISDNRRRNRVFGILEGYGVPVQLSVFECEVNSEQLVVMKYEISRIINNRKDRVIYYELCKNCRKRTDRVGNSRGQMPGSVIIV